MSYGASDALQAAVYQRLTLDAGVTGLIGTAIFDELPQGTKPETYVVLGEEEVRDRSDGTGAAALHRFTVSVVTDAAGYAGAKQVAAAISDALVGAPLSLSRGRLIGLWFERATARRSGKAGKVRRIDLKFRAHVDDT